MKKFLLSIMAIVLSAGAVNAQSFGTAIEGKAALKSKLHSIAVAPKANQSVQKIKSNEFYWGYTGADNPSMTDGFPGYDCYAVGAQYNTNTEFVNEYAGSKVVGMAFIVCGSLGEDASCFVFSKEKETYFELNDKNYSISTIDSEGNLDTKWNEVYFKEPIEINSNTEYLRWGYLYTQEKDEKSENAYPLLLGEVSNTNKGYSYLAYGDLGQDEGWYLCADDDNWPYTLCSLLILQKPSGETAIIGVNGEKVASPEQYFSVNGTRLAAPQKGVNIVKMSDGKTKKVLVK